MINKLKYHTWQFWGLWIFAIGGIGILGFAMVGYRINQQAAVSMIHEKKLHKSQQLAAKRKAHDQLWREIQAHPMKMNQSPVVKTIQYDHYQWMHSLDHVKGVNVHVDAEALPVTSIQKLKNGVYRFNLTHHQVAISPLNALVTKDYTVKQLKAYTLNIKPSVVTIENRLVDDTILHNQYPHVLQLSKGQTDLRQATVGPYYKWKQTAVFTGWVSQNGRQYLKLKLLDKQHHQYFLEADQSKMQFMYQHNQMNRGK